MKEFWLFTGNAISSVVQSIPFISTRGTPYRQKRSSKKERKGYPMDRFSDISCVYRYNYAWAKSLDTWQLPTETPVAMRIKDDSFTFQPPTQFVLKDPLCWRFRMKQYVYSSRLILSFLFCHKTISKLYGQHYRSYTPEYSSKVDLMSLHRYKLDLGAVPPLPTKALAQGDGGRVDVSMTLCVGNGIEQQQKLW